MPRAPGKVMEKQSQSQTPETPMPEQRSPASPGSPESPPLSRDAWQAKHQKSIDRIKHIDACLAALPEGAELRDQLMTEKQVLEEKIVDRRSIGSRLDHCKAQLRKKEQKLSKAEKEMRAAVLAFEEAQEECEQARAELAATEREYSELHPLGVRPSEIQQIQADMHEVTGQLNALTDELAKLEPASAAKRQRGEGGAAVQEPYERLCHSIRTNMHKLTVQTQKLAMAAEPEAPQQQAQQQVASMPGDDATTACPALAAAAAPAARLRLDPMPAMPSNPAMPAMPSNPAPTQVDEIRMRR